MATTPYQCPVCLTQPGAHSFEKRRDINGVDVFYTCPSKAIKYNDIPGILAHYEGMLDANEDRPWWWVFDCTGFSLKHMVEVNVGIGLAKLISKKYSGSLKRVVIVNPTWYVRTMINVVWPFLTKQVRDGICIVNDDILLDGIPVSLWMNKPHIEAPHVPGEPNLVRTTF